MKRRRCKLANSDYKDIDLREYENVIIETINNTVPGKNLVVCKNISIRMFCPKVKRFLQRHIKSVSVDDNDVRIEMN